MKQMHASVDQMNRNHVTLSVKYTRTLCKLALSHRLYLIPQVLKGKGMFTSRFSAFSLVCIT